MRQKRPLIRVLGIVIAVFLVASCAAPPFGESASALDLEPAASEQAVPTQKPPTTTITQGDVADELSDTLGEQVNFEGDIYDCEEATSGHWDCERRDKSIYCSGVLGPDDCSKSWYPDEFGNVRLVVFEGRDYACEKFGTGCVTYLGGPPPISFAFPEIWCEGQTCSEYDPDKWFQLTFDFSSYFCEDALLGFQHFDCYQSFGGSAPTVTAFEPDVYCSGVKSFLDCSENWYPDDLAGYEFISYNGSDYVCESSYLGSFGDYDCGWYFGGNPDHVYSQDLKCTDRGYSFECDPDYYPSEMDGLSFSYIGGSQYVCQDSYGGSECFRYLFGSPKAATYGLPDLYCNWSGLCDPWGYP